MSDPTPEPYQEELDTGVPVTDAWVISDLPTADWALGRVCDLEREIAENERVAQLAIDRIKMRTEALNERARRGAGFFLRKIATFAEGNRDLLLGGGKKKSRTLLHGSIGFRKGGGGLSVVDKDALLDWAREQPVETNVLRIKEEPAMSEIKARFKATGELPAGCELEPEREEVVVKTEMGEKNHEH